MRLVLDTNVWLDWLVFRDAGVAHIFHAVAAGRATVWMDEACRAELARVLRYPLLGTPLDDAAQAAHLAAACAVAQLPVRGIRPRCDLPRCRDPDDQKFLELALDCGADALVSKDRALLELARPRRERLPFVIAAPADLVF